MRPCELILKQLNSINIILNGRDTWKALAVCTDGHKPFGADLQAIISKLLDGLIESFAIFHIRSQDCFLRSTEKALPHIHAFSWIQATVLVIILLLTLSYTRALLACFLLYTDRIKYRKLVSSAHLKNKSRMSPCRSFLPTSVAQTGQNYFVYFFYNSFGAVWHLQSSSRSTPAVPVAT